MGRTSKEDTRFKVIRCDMDRPDEKQAYEKLELLADSSGLPVRKIFALLMKSLTIDGFCLSIEAKLNTEQLRFDTELNKVKREKKADASKKKDIGNDKEDATPDSSDSYESISEDGFYKGYRILENGMLEGEDGQEISRMIADYQYEQKHKEK